MRHKCVSTFFIISWCFTQKCSPLAPAQRRTCQNIHTEWNELAEALSPEESKEGVSAAFNPGNDQEQCWCCNRSNVNRRVQTLIKMCAKIMQGVCMEVCVYVCVCVHAYCTHGFLCFLTQSLKVRVFFQSLKPVENHFSSQRPLLTPGIQWSSRRVFY